MVNFRRRKVPYEPLLSRESAEDAWMSLELRHNHEECSGRIMSPSPALAGETFILAKRTALSDSYLPAYWQIRRN